MNREWRAGQVDAQPVARFRGDFETCVVDARRRERVKSEDRPDSAGGAAVWLGR